MKICAAQITPIKGQLIANLTKHKNLIQLAASHDVRFIFFPELSLTGYEPTLAKDLAANPDDARLDELQRMSNDRGISIAAGLPIKNTAGTIFIGMMLFQPFQLRQIYCKQFLHADETPYFSPGNADLDLNFENLKLAPAICYESLLSEHSHRAARRGANFYFASVAKSANGIEKANRHFPKIAKKYAMTVMMSNSLGPSDNFIGAGNTSVWNREGKMVACLNDRTEGLLIYDTSTQSTQELYV